MLKSILKNIAWFFYYLFIACLLWTNSFGYLDPDYGWHLKFGEIISQTRSMPHDQIFMWSLNNKSWVDHEWLSNLITYGLNLFGGYIMVSLFFVIIPLLTIFIINRYVFKTYLNAKREKIFFAILQLFGIFGCLPHFGVRMQELAFLLFSLELITLDKFRNSHKIKYLLWLIPLIYFWACLHGSYLIGIAIIIGMLLYELGLIIFPKTKNLANETSLDIKKYFLAAAILLVAILTSCLTPYGKELYDFLKDYGSNRYYLSHIEEWRSPYSLPLRYDQIAFSVLIFTLFLGSYFFAKQKIKPWKLASFIALLVLASRSVRHFPLFLVSSLILIIPTSIRGNLDAINIPYKRYLKALTIICLILIGSSLLIQSKTNKTPFRSYCDYYPCQAVDFIKNNKKYSKLKLFNDYGWGGYIIGTDYGIRPFIDGRLPQYPYKNHSLLEEYSDFFKKDLVAKKLKEHDVEIILFKSKEPPYEPDFFEKYFLGKKYEERKNPLLEFLKDSNNWSLVYNDDIAFIYVRKDKK